MGEQIQAIAQRLSMLREALDITPEEMAKEPVSYTHLDVYKRQAQHDAQDGAYHDGAGRKVMSPELVELAEREIYQCSG